MRKVAILGALGLLVTTALFFGLNRGGSATSADPGYPVAPLNITPAAGQIRQTHAARVVDGQSWSLTSFTNERGQICAGEKVPNDGGEGGQGLTCRNPETLFSNGPLVYFVGARQLPGQLKRWANAWVWGWAGPNVARLELQMTDCSAIPLAIDGNRLFFHVFGGGTIARSVGPQELIAYGADGKVVDSKPTPLSAPSSPQARAAGATAPTRTTC